MPGITTAELETLSLAAECYTAIATLSRPSISKGKSIALLAMVALRYSPCLDSATRDPDLSKLTVAHELQEISSVEYAHDPVPNPPSYLALPDDMFLPTCLTTDAVVRKFAIRLHPQASHLPYRCTLQETYESRFWRSGLDSSTKLLQLLASDQSATDFVVRNGITMAKLAQRELCSGFEHRFCKASMYMYPFASEERTRLLAASMVMMFLFDDKGEETADSTLKPFIDDFVKRLANHESDVPSKTELQSHIDMIMQGFRKADSTLGKAGHAVIEAMSQSFRRMRPERKFHNLRQYLDFRHDNVGANYVLAAVRFSICSEVDITDPRLNRYLTLLKDHLAIINDMASFDKEKRDFDQDPSKVMINIVDVVQQLLSTPDINSAKALAYTYQIQTEVWMKQELQRLEDQENFDAEIWRYLQATYVCAAGNAFFSMTSSRYGGDAARIRCQSNTRLKNLAPRKRQADEEIDRPEGKRNRSQQAEIVQVDQGVRGVTLLK